jgi:predicted transposase/invertase (TIGR01784 family)
VEILNPYNEREFLDDKLSVVDVKARDAAGGQYQVEVQLLAHRDLPARMLYGWADLYAAQLTSGQTYGQLRPTFAIWLLAAPLLPEVPGYAHDFRWRDAGGRLLLDHGGIWLLELSKFAAAEVRTEQERWLKFLIEAERLDDSALPEWMQTREMKKAMTTLKAFSEKERAYHAYQARQNYLRIQQSIQEELADLRGEVERERAELERVRAKVEWEHAEVERNRAEAEQARLVAEQARAAEERAHLAEEQARTAADQARAAEAQERAAKQEALAEIERLRRLLDSR